MPVRLGDVLRDGQVMGLVFEGPERLKGDTVGLLREEGLDGTEMEVKGTRSPPVEEDGVVLGPEGDGAFA